MTKTYALTEIFPTIQGEGSHAGTPAVFVRFASCNLWTGKPEHRERDAQRHMAKCPQWCDTDFSVKLRLGAKAIADAVREAAHQGGMRMGLPLVVLTGGEPLLQVDDELIRELDALTNPSVMTIAVETNGTLAPALSRPERLWYTCSPKTPAEMIQLRHVDELKVVFPAYNPLEYEHLLSNPKGGRFVQPEAVTDIDSIGKSVVHKVNMLQAANWVMNHPRWRLSLQTHKMIGLP